MQVKDTEFRRVLEVLLHDENLQDYTVGVDLGELVIGVDDIVLDTENKIARIELSEELIFDNSILEPGYEEDEGFLMGSHEEQ